MLSNFFSLSFKQVMHCIMLLTAMMKGCDTMRIIIPTIQTVVRIGENLCAEHLAVQITW